MQTLYYAAEVVSNPGELGEVKYHMQYMHTRWTISFKLSVISNFLGSAVQSLTPIRQTPENLGKVIRMEDGRWRSGKYFQDFVSDQWTSGGTERSYEQVLRFRSNLVCMLLTCKVMFEVFG